MPNTKTESSLQMNSARRTGLFLSYSHKDDRWRQKLQTHLAPYVRRGDLTLWDDTRIGPGDLWRSEIRAAIDRAAASVLLISADFLASEFVVSEELPRLLKKAEKGGARILSIVVRPCRLDAHPELAAYQALNHLDKPLSSLKPSSKADDVLARAAGQIATLMRQAVDGTDDSGAGGADSLLFEQLQSASITLAVLDVLVGASEQQVPSFTIGDLTRILKIRSRKLGYEAVERLVAARWVAKQRPDKIHTTFSVTPQGVRQLQLLVAASDGPLRRSR